MEIKTLLKNKYVMVITTFIVLLCIYVSIGMASAVSISQETIYSDKLREYQNKEFEVEDELSSLEADKRGTKNGYYESPIWTKERYLLFVNNKIEYYNWMAGQIQEMKQIIIDNRPFDEILKKHIKILIVEQMADYSMSIGVRGSEPILSAEEIVGKELLEEYGIVIEELPFSFAGLGEGLTTEELEKVNFQIPKESLEEMEKTIYNGGVLLEAISKEVSAEKLMYGGGAASPYVFLFRMFELESLPQLVLGFAILLIPILYYFDRRKTGAYRLGVYKNYSNCKQIFSEVGMVVGTCLLVVIVGIGIPTILWGLLSDFKGLYTPQVVIANNFSSFVPKTRHDGLTIIGLSITYNDVIKQQDGYTWEVLLEPIKVITLGKYLWLSSVIAFLKVFFLSLVGIIVGKIGKNAGQILAIGSIVTVIFALSQMVQTACVWNPFSIKSGWKVTGGWTNMTWLNAVVLLTISIVVLILALFVIEKTKEEG